MGKDFTCQECLRSFRSSRAFKCHKCSGKPLSNENSSEDESTTTIDPLEGLPSVKLEPEDLVEFSNAFEDELLNDQAEDEPRLQIKEEEDLNESGASGDAETEANTSKGFPCLVCKEEFETESGRGTHLCKAHDAVKPYSCPVCKKKFLQQQYVAVHMKLHSGDRPYKCKLCPNAYTHKTSYTIHMRIHNGERPYACTVCGKRCYDKSGLTSHMRSHTKETPYKCNVCAREFTHSKSLLVHKRNHTGEKPYVCQYCNKAFRHWHKHKIHTRLHTGERPYKCKVCGKGFPRNDEVNRHMKSHIGIKSFRCSICGVFCATQASITGHINLHHSDLKEGSPPAKTVVTTGRTGILGSESATCYGNIYKNIVTQSNAVANILKATDNSEKQGSSSGTTKVIEVTSKDTPLILPKKKTSVKVSNLSPSKQDNEEHAPLNYKEFIEWQEKMLQKQGLVVKGLPGDKETDTTIKTEPNSSNAVTNPPTPVTEGQVKPPQFLLLSQQAPDGTIQKILVPISSLTPAQTNTNPSIPSNQAASKPLLMVSNGSQKMLLMPPTTVLPTTNPSIKEEPEDPLAINIKEEKISPPSSPVCMNYDEVTVKQEPVE